MSSILDARGRLASAIEGAGVRIATGSKVAAPCVHIEPGDPWSQPVRLPGRVSRWQLTAIAGRADSDGAFEALGELLDRIDAGIKTLPAAQLPEWAKPGDLTIEGVPYAAMVATIQLDQYNGGA